MTFRSLFSCSCDEAVTPQPLNVPRSHQQSARSQCLSRHPVWASWAVCFVLAFPFSTQAGPGHDHGDEHANQAPPAAALASPRFVISSELFEAVGIVKGKTIEIYVDHAQTNAPVENASLTLELNGTQVPVELHAAGEFDAVLPAVFTEGHSESLLSVAMTIKAGDQVELLAGELVLAHDDAHQSAEDVHSHTAEFAWYGLGGLLLLALLVLGKSWAHKLKQTQVGK